MKQKTAIHTLLDALDKELKSDAIHNLTYNDGLQDIKDYILENLLEKEKEQIIEARNSALRDKYKSIINDLTTYGQSKIDVKSSEDYFNETYKQD